MGDALSSVRAIDLERDTNGTLALYLLSMGNET